MLHTVLSMILPNPASPYLTFHCLSWPSPACQVAIDRHDNFGNAIWQIIILTDPMKILFLPSLSTIPLSFSLSLFLFVFLFYIYFLLLSTYLTLIPVLVFLPLSPPHSSFFLLFIPHHALLIFPLTLSFSFPPWLLYLPFTLFTFIHLYLPTVIFLFFC